MPIAYYASDRAELLTWANRYRALIAKQPFASAAWRAELREIQGRLARLRQAYYGPRRAPVTHIKTKPAKAA